MDAKGDWSDAVQAQCSAAGRRWAKDHHGMQITFKATFSKHGEEPARVLCRSWCHRMQYFYNLEQEAGGPGFVFTPAMVAGYMEPDELTALVRDGSNPHWFERINVIRTIPH